MEANLDDRLSNDIKNTFSFMDMKNFYERYNPVTRYVIRPSLKLVNAHDHPIRGGIAAAISSTITHYSLVEAIAQASDYFFGTNLKDSQTKLALTALPWPVHLCFGMNALSNITTGLVKYYSRRQK